MKRSAVLVMALAASLSVNAAQTEAQMAERAKESLTRNSAYEMESVKVFWGDASLLFECAHKNKPLPESFVIYFEVLPDGSMGQLLFSPMTKEAQCIQSHLIGRTFPPPPGGAYVTRIVQTFEP